MLELEFQELNKIINLNFFSGIGLLKFIPKTEYLGKWNELQPLGTQYQGRISGKEP